MIGKIGRNSAAVARKEFGEEFKTIERSNPVEATKNCAAEIFEGLFGYPPTEVTELEDYEVSNNETETGFSRAGGGAGTLDEVSIEITRFFGLSGKYKAPEMKISICFSDRNGAKQQAEIKKELGIFTVGQAIAFFRGKTIAHM